MNQYEILSKEKHRQLRVKTGYGRALGDAAMYAMTYPMEFRDNQGCYPILFTKDQDTNLVQNGIAHSAREFLSRHVQ